MPDQPLRIFFGSSGESASFMETVASWAEADEDCRLVLWNAPETFPAGKYTFHRLLELTRLVDAAVFIFGEDDKVWYRGDETSQPRDNVLLEYGLFASKLGPERSVICRVAKSRLSSDLLGLTTVNFPANRHLNGKKKFLHWLQNCKEARHQANGELVELPTTCEHVARHLLPDEIAKSLDALPEWSLVLRADREGLVMRQMLRRVYRFVTFTDAISFMSRSTEEIEQLNHHPEWENVWTQVTVHTTTWNAGHRVTRLDCELAKHLDATYKQFQHPAAPATSKS